MGFTDIVKGIGKSTWDQIPIVSAVKSMGKAKDGISALKDGDMSSFAREQVNDFVGEDIYPTEEGELGQSKQFEDDSKGAYLDQDFSHQKGNITESSAFSKLMAGSLKGVYPDQESDQAGMSQAGMSQAGMSQAGMSQASMNSSLDSFGSWAENKAVLDKESAANERQKDDNEGMVEF